MHDRSIFIEEIPPACADCTVVVEIHLTRLKICLMSKPTQKMQPDLSEICFFFVFLFMRTDWKRDEGKTTFDK